jgi:ATP-binding cassette subfamily B protein
VDVRTESAILDAMDRLMRGRTVFMIAHRHGSLETCDVWLELDQGRIVSGPAVESNGTLAPIR